MAKYYGTLSGRGTVTRSGNSETGIRASIQSWDGSVMIALNHSPSGELMVQLSYAEDSRSTGGQYLFYGTLQELVERLKEV